MKKANILILLFLWLSKLLSAQIIEPIKWNITSKSNGTTLTLLFSASVETGWHVYDQNQPEGGPISTEFVYEEKSNVKKIGTARPNIAPTDKFEEMFGMNLRWFDRDVTFQQEIQLSDPNDYSVKGHVRFMACNDNTCLPPSEIPFSFEKHEKATVTKEKTDLSAQEEKRTTPFVFSELNKDTTSRNNETETTVSDLINEEDAAWSPVIAELQSFGESEESESGNVLWNTFIIGLLGGLLAIATPCVWPIIPMTVSFFLRKKDGSGKESALLYGLSIIVIYVGLGILLTLLFGADALNQLSTNAVFNLFLFFLLVFFAISFFGGFNLSLPASWSTQTENKADNTTGILSILLMAFTLVIVSFSCTGPIIGTLLVHISTQGNLLSPIIGMLGFAIALAGPFTLFALFPNIMKKMPKSGGWLNIVKVLLGFFELAFALKFLSVADLAYGWHILDREVFLVLWIVIVSFAGLYIIGKIQFKSDDPVEHLSVGRLFGGMAAFAFALYLLPGLWGAPLKTISAFAPPLWTQDFNLYEETEAKFNDYDDAFAYAKKQGKPLLVDFSGYGCVNCRKMEASVWNDPKVSSIINDKYVLVSLFLDDKTALETPMEVRENDKTIVLKTIGEKWSYLERHKFGANAMPFYVLIGNDGKPLNKSYAYSEDVDAFVEFLQTGLKNYTK